MSRTNGKSAAADPEPTGSALFNPVTVADMVAGYNRAIEMIEDGYRKLGDAQGELNRTFGDKRSFSVMDREHYHDSNVEKVKKQLFREVWRAIVDKMDVWKVLSLKDADELRELLDKGELVRGGQVQRTLPPITDENVLDMYEAMRQNAPEYARKFANEVYEWLTPASKSDSRWEAGYATNKRNGRDELGKKVILGWMIESSFRSGHPFQVNYHHQDKMAALDRLFYLLDGRPVPETSSYYSPSNVAIYEADTGGYAETEYFILKAHYNGNLHITFKRLDLVQKLNQLAGNQVDLKQPKHKVKQGDHTVVDVPYEPDYKASTYEEDFYWTPEAVVKFMLDKVPLPGPLILGSMKFLEPSAGEGHIADCLVAAGVRPDQLTLVEKNYERVGVLLRKGYQEVRDVDFLKFDREGFDFIFMNPPFSQRQSIKHVMHAYKLLAPGGWLCSVMSDGDFYSSDNTAVYFREWFNRVGMRAQPLPKNSFAAAGTSWDTRVVWVQRKK